MPNYRSHKGLMGGLLILAIGVILLLDQQGVVSAGHVFRLFWPAFFMLLGFEDLVAGFSPQKRVWGGLIFLGGSVLLLNNLGYIHVRFALLGPIVLISLGVWMLVWGNRRSWQGGVFGPWGPLGPHGPLGPRGPLGPNGPLGPSGPLGPNGPIGRAFGSSNPGPQAPPSQNQGQPNDPTAQAPPTPPPAQGPGNPTQYPYGNAPGFAGGAAPQGWRDWRRSHKREFKRHMRAWKHGWVPHHWEQQQNWAGQQPTQGPTPFDSNESQFNYSVICSHVERHITAKNFKSGTLSAILGGFEIDLSQADIEGDQAVIYADAIFGGGEIRIPQTWHVVIEGSALFGAFMDETRQRPPEGSTPAKKLIIRGTAVFGGVSIEN